MSESSFLDLFHSRWQRMSRQFWPQRPREQLQDKLSGLSAELRRRQSRLLLLRKRIEKIHPHLKQREYRLAALLSKTPTDAERTAKLERLQRNIDHARESLRKREHGYATQLTRLRQRKKVWAELRERLLSGAIPKKTTNESDLDYPF